MLDMSVCRASARCVPNDKGGVTLGRKIKPHPSFQEGIIASPDEVVELHYWNESRKQVQRCWYARLDKCWYNVQRFGCSWGIRWRYYDVSTAGLADRHFRKYLYCGVMEVCPNCEQEVELTQNFCLQQCPVCKEYIKPCSLCYDLGVGCQPTGKCPLGEDR